MIIIKLLCRPLAIILSESVSVDGATPTGTDRSLVDVRTPLITGHGGARLLFDLAYEKPKNTGATVLFPIVCIRRKV